MGGYACVRWVGGVLVALVVAAPASAVRAGWVLENSVMSNSSAVLSVDAVDGGRGYAVGMLDTGGSQTGMLLSSAGTGSWDTVYQADSALLSALWFDDASHGFIGGMKMEGFSFRAFIAETGNGGASFTEVTVPGGGGLLDADVVMGIAFAPGGDGFAWTGAGELWRSVDGGASWVEQTSPLEGPAWRDLRFVDGEVGFLVGALSGDDGGDDDDTDWKDERGGPSDGAVLRTTDGGASWQVMTRDLPVDLQGAAFFDADHGIVVGHDDGGARIYTTSDGGATLDPASLPTDGEGRGIDVLYDVVAPCGNQAWAVGAIFTEESGETGITAILFSSDGGRSWSLDPWPQELVDGMFDLSQYHTLLDVAFAGPEFGVAGGSEMAVLRYQGEGLDCAPLDDNPLAGDDDGAGAGGCDCKDDADTTAARSAPYPAVALGALAAFGVRRRRRG